MPTLYENYPGRNAMEPYLSELDDVSKMEMAATRLDLWHENCFLQIFEGMEEFSEKFAQLADAQRARDYEGPFFDIARIKAPKEFERAKVSRDAGFTKLAAYATSELEKLANEVVGSEKEHGRIAVQRETLVEQAKAFQTSLTLEQHARESHLEGISQGLERKLDELQHDSSQMVEQRDISQRKIMQCMEAVKSSCSSMLQSERESRKKGEELQLQIIENLFACLELKQSQQSTALKNLFTNIAETREQRLIPEISFRPLLYEEPPSQNSKSTMDEFSNNITSKAPSKLSKSSTAGPGDFESSNIFGKSDPDRQTSDLLSPPPRSPGSAIDRIGEAGVARLSERLGERLNIPDLVSQRNEASKAGASNTVEAKRGQINPALKEMYDTIKRKRRSEG